MDDYEERKEEGNARVETSKDGFFLYRRARYDPDTGRRLEDRVTEHTVAGLLSDIAEFEEEVARQMDALAKKISARKQVLADLEEKDVKDVPAEPADSGVA